MRGRTAMLAWLSLLLPMVLAGCGVDDRVAVNAGSGLEPEPGSVTDTWSTFYSLRVGGVRAGDDGRSLVLHIDRLPVEPASRHGCEVETSTDVEYADDLIYVTTSARSYVYFGDPTFPNCETAGRDLTIALDGPLDGRQVVTQDPGARWVPTGDGTYQTCQLPACDAATGQPPLPAGCDDTSLVDAVRAGDVPRHVGFGNERCELPWAVIDIDVGAGSCPVTGDGANPCAGSNVHRTYWKATGYTWTQVGSSLGPGCGDGTSIPPEFPRRLCQDLPALT